VVRILEQGAARFLRALRLTLFWDPLSRDWLAIAMGAFDTPTQTRLTEHIFVAEKGDYYDIADGVTQFEKWPPRAAPGD